MALSARLRPLWLSTLLALATVGGGTLAAPGVAEARVSGEVTYTYAQTWQAAVRLVRVDLGCPITDRDEEMGFVLFEYQNAGRSYPGSLEVVRSTDERGVEHIRVTVQVNAMPSYVERMIFDRLTRKLREDFGEARTPRRPPTPPAQPAPPAEDPPAASPPPGAPSSPGEASE
jgi:hypothetical protein